MPTIYFSSASAWLALMLIGATITVPYIMHAWSGTFLRRMRLHMWLGYVIIVLVVAHAMAAMSAGGISRINQTGLWAATLALVLIVVQLILGLQLAQPACQKRSIIRRWHFWIMIGLIVTALSHTILNSPSLTLLVQ